MSTPFVALCHVVSRPWRRRIWLHYGDILAVYQTQDHAPEGAQE